MHIIPALLAQSKEDFLEKLKKVDKILPIVQVDIMDGTFTPNANFWDPEELFGIHTNAQYELHMMVDHPKALIPRFADHPNIHRIYFHAECKDSPSEIIEEGAYYGFDMGVVFNPETPTSIADDYLHTLKSVMFMGVTPGAMGQPFVESTIDKIATFHAAHPEIEIEIDGGVSSATISALAKAGATRFVVGSALYKNPDGIEAAIKELTLLAKKI